MHSDKTAATAGEERARCDPSGRSRRATGRARWVLALLGYLRESELSAVEDQHALFAGRALWLHTHFLQQSANLVKLILAEN